MLSKPLIPFLTAFLFAGSLLGGPYQSSQQNPSWFPKTECAASFAAKAGQAKIDYRYRYASPSGGEDYSDYYQRIHRSACFKDLTVLVYMQADNNLNDYALMDLYEMEIGYQSNPTLTKTLMAGSGLHTDIVAQVDTLGNEGRTRFHLHQTPEFKRRDEIKKVEDFKGKTLSMIRSPVVEKLSEVDDPSQAASQAPSQAKDLQAFLEWGVRKYPARHYMVIVWGHGKGWSANAIARDEYPELSAISIPELHDSLKSINQTILEGKRPIDLYASDACLMQSLEVVTELSDVVRFVHGSEQIQNFMGLPYRRILYEINSGRFAGERAKIEGLTGKPVPRETLDTPYFIARMIPKLMWESLNPKMGSQGVPQPQANKSMTFSSYAAAEIEQALIPAFKEFSEAAVSYVEENPDQFVRMLNVVKGVPRMDGGVADIGAFAALVLDTLHEQVTTDPEPTASTLRLQEAAHGLLTAATRSVMSKAHGELYLLGPYALGSFKALSVWLPFFPAEVQGENSRLASFHKSRLFQLMTEPSTGLSQWEVLLKRLFEM